MPATGHQCDLFACPPPPSTKNQPPPQSNPPTACYWDYCPNCGAQLHNVGCKYRCTRCHYFMSCSDFD